METIIHPFKPIYDSHSRVLILGTMPSPKSRENRFYYGHPRNRFWPIMADLFGYAPFQSNGEKTAFLLDHHIALWDVIASCTITGSSDLSIRDVTPTDLRAILTAAPIRAIYCNGAAAHKLYCRYQQPLTNLPALRLPSTSPANASWTLPRLIDAWKAIQAPYPI